MSSPHQQNGLKPKLMSPPTHLRPQRPTPSALPMEKHDGNRHHSSGEYLSDGSYYRFHFKNHLPSFGHMDVYCSWDKDQKELDTYELGPNMQYMHRIGYTKSKWSSEHYVVKASAAYKQFVEDRHVDIEELTSFVAGLAPRSISDMKPLLVLVQGLLKKILTNEWDVVNKKMIMDLRSMDAALKECYTVIAQLKEREAELLGKLNAAEEELERLVMSDSSSTPKLQSSASFARTAALDISISHEKQAAAMSASKWIRNFQKSLEVPKEELASRAELAKELEELKKEMEVLRAKLESEAKRADEREKHHVMKISKEKMETDKQKKEVAKLHQEVEEAKLGHRERELELKNETRAAEQQAEYFRNRMDYIEMDGLRGDTKTLFLPWMHYMPVVECEWALNLVRGMATVSLPAGSQITLPDDSEARTPFHVVDIPGESTVHIPASESPVQISMPPYCCLTFPNKESGELVLGGGTSVIIPEGEGVRKYEVVLSMGCAVHPGSTDPICFAGKTLKDISVGPTPPPTPGQGTRPEPEELEVIIAPKGDPTTHMVPAGSTIVMPFGLVSTVTVPSKVRLLIPTGISRIIKVPGGSTLLLNKQEKKKDDVVLLPSKAVITLPMQPGAASKHGEEFAALQGSYFAYLPHGSEVVVPKGVGKLRVTLVPGCSVSTPVSASSADGERAACLVGPGDTAIVDAVIPQHITVMGGTRIVLPEAIPLDAHVIAQRMVELGPEAVSAAIGGMDNIVAAEALALLSPAQAALILQLARPQSAAAVMRRMPPGDHMAYIFEHLPVSQVGAILAHLDNNDLLATLDRSFNKDHRLYRPMLAKMECWLKTEELLKAPAVTIRQVVECVQQLDPSVSGRLLAVATAQRSAFTLMRLAARSHTQASENMNALAEMSMALATLGTRYKEHDMRRALLQQELARVTTDALLDKRIRQLMVFLHDSYGIACTLSRYGEHEPQSLLMEEDGKLDHSPSGREMAAVDNLEILCTTEDVVWGAGGGGMNLQTQQNSKSNALTHLTVTMSAVALQQAQDEAFETKKTVFTDLLLVVPIFLPLTGVPWGAIVHINKNQAASSIMGNIFQKPKHNSFPKAVECLQAMAAAIGVAVGAMEKLQLELAPEVRDATGDEAIAALKAGKAVVNNQSLRLSLARSIDRGTRERKALLNYMVHKNADATLQMLTALRGMANPPRVIKTILLVMLISFNTEELEEHLGEDLLTLPEENSEADHLLWSFVRKNINLNSRHPRYIMRLLKDSSKGFTGFHNNVDLLRKTHASVTMLMDGVTRDGVKYASSQAVGLFDYVQLIQNMLDANLHLENLGGLDTEDDASDSKSSHGSKSGG